MKPIFEPVFQELRIQKVLPHVKRNSVIVDVGCDDPPVLLNRVKENMKQCIGLDIVIDNKQTGNIKLLRQDLQKKIDLPNDTADVITLLAVLEHMKYPSEIVAECFRVLKNKGTLLITVPSPKSKGVLELFSRLRLVRSEMIDQHENYFTKESLGSLCRKAGFKKVQVESFEFGYNTFVKAIK